MFSQRKSFLKGKLFYIILLGLFSFGIWLNQAPIVPNSADDIHTDSNYPVSTNGAVDQENKGNYDIMDNIIGGKHILSPEGVDISDTPGNQNDATNSGYFLVKEVDGIIKIFFYDEKGKESFIKETGIAFSLLSVADQALFQKGVIKHTSDELDELLQDFES